MTWEPTLRDGEMILLTSLWYERFGAPPMHAELAKMMGVCGENARQRRCKLFRKWRKGLLENSPGLFPDKWMDLT